MADDFYDLPKHSTIRNYIIPGLTSHLIGDWSDPNKERLRLFEMETHQLVHIVPHSHRYNFHCRVIAGEVINTLWQPIKESLEVGALMAKSSLTYNGTPGTYVKGSVPSIVRYIQVSSLYPAGAEYSMRHYEIHSITFAAGTKVLFWESPQITEETYILEPYIPGYGTVPLLKTEPWMYLKDNPDA